MKRGSQHSIQLVALLHSKCSNYSDDQSVQRLCISFEDRKETYRSDLFQFVVPQKEQSEVICVSQEPVPDVSSGLSAVNSSFAADAW